MDTPRTPILVDDKSFRNEFWQSASARKGFILHPREVDSSCPQADIELISIYCWHAFCFFISRFHVVAIQEKLLRYFYWSELSVNSK